MTERFRNKYRIESARLQNWNYGWNAAYFVTICTQNKEYYLGRIQDGEMLLSEIGEISEKIWHEIPKKFTYAQLDAFVVMPNHFHGIIIIDKSNDERMNYHSGIDGYNSGMNGRDAINRVSTVPTPTELTSKTPGGITGNKNPMLHDNLSRIIRWFKGRISFESRKIHADFEWQSRYYEHIIRDNASYVRIQNYIADNPLNWNFDKFKNHNGNDL